jgi:hypothetical protein
MATGRAQDLHAFKSFLDQQLVADPVPTVGEVIARWADENQSDVEHTDSVHAVNQRRADIEAGESRIPAREAVVEFQKNYGLTTDARTLQSNPEEWVKRLQAWVDSHPVEPTTMDDSRESIYAGRGE